MNVDSVGNMNVNTDENRCVCQPPPPTNYNNDRDTFITFCIGAKAKKMTLDVTND